ncbi:hypothetical protein HHK36_028806 [Tetracentron sinense]|uniref:Uncharacterized protein n=1 Tax=Tetracentron sinense TaxID=13715 RepID=A0A835D0K6_TETSI|nr:hypothetical protein HHK36_028806 [Tetracentron sinense]
MPMQKPNVERIEELKKEVSRMLRFASNEPMNEIYLIDMLQHLGIAYHFHKEIGQALQRMWWKDIDFATKLPFARDRLVECYFWGLGVYFEPQYAPCRIFMAKLVSIVSIINDIYDVYRTPEELQLFTDAIQGFEEKRGHVASSVQCYMKEYKVLRRRHVKSFKRWWKGYGDGYIESSSRTKENIASLLIVPFVI